MHLYLHIPFCKQACHYCDFHFSTNTSKKTDVVKAICKEIELQKDFLKSKSLQTIYFGGGTPSLLNSAELELIFSHISKHFVIETTAEITLECNPDDITVPRLKEWLSVGINRLSIGIQSFNNEHLRFLNRAHHAEHSEKCIHEAMQTGFHNLSIDLIYAIPSESNEIWKSDLQKAFSFGASHISSYCLTIEEKTVFGNKVRQNTMKPIDDDFASEQFNILLEQMTINGFEQYEISNFAKDGHYAIHNTSYWQGDEYLGVGPSAHSFNGNQRFWNISNNSKYLKSIAGDIIPSEFERLTEHDKANEYLMTGLRTKWGVDTNKLSQWVSLDSIDFNKTLNEFENCDFLKIENTIITLTNNGKLKADYIASELFF